MKENNQKIGRMSSHSDSTPKKLKELVTRTTEENENKKTERKSIGSNQTNGSNKKMSINENREERISDFDQKKDSAVVEQRSTRNAPKSSQNIPFFLFQPDSNQMNAQRALLPPIHGRDYTLVLDLDETLVHFQEKENGKSQFLIRPYAQFFLKEMSKYYELVIFTAGLQDYADFILDKLDTKGWLSHRLYRRHCYFQNNVYQKDLSRLGRELSKTMIVDNNAENFQLQPDNGIYIKSWYDDPDDKALLELAPILKGKPKFLNNFSHLKFNKFPFTNFPL